MACARFVNLLFLDFFQDGPNEGEEHKDDGYAEDSAKKDGGLHGDEEPEEEEKEKNNAPTEGGTVHAVAVVAGTEGEDEGEVEKIGGRKCKARADEALPSKSADDEKTEHHVVDNFEGHIDN